MNLSKFFQAIPFFPGKPRIARALLGKRLNSENVHVRDKDHSEFLVPSISESIGFHLFIDGCFEPMTLKFLLSYSSPGGTFIDVGANIGVFTIPVSKKVGPAGRVVAFEPSPRILPYLEYNIKVNNLNNVYVYPSAVYDCKTANLPFYEAPAKKFGMGSLAPQFDSPIFVSTITFDEAMVERNIQRLDVIKVDVEGFESLVFKGAQNFLTDYSPLIVFEFCDWAEERALAAGIKIGDSQKILLDYGYKIWRLQDFLKGKPPLPSPILRGFEMLVAQRRTDK